MLSNMFSPLVLRSLTFDPTVNNITTSTSLSEHIRHLIRESGDFSSVAVAYTSPPS